MLDLGGKKYTQADLASDARLSPQLLQRIEVGTRRPSEPEDRRIMAALAKRAARCGRPAPTRAEVGLTIDPDGPKVGRPKRKTVSSESAHRGEAVSAARA